VPSGPNWTPPPTIPIIYLGNSKSSGEEIHLLMNSDIKIVYALWLRQCFHISRYSQEDRFKTFCGEWRSALVGHTEPIGRLYAAGMPKV
jgi:hypothetical protein